MKVLVVEDEVDLREVLVFALESQFNAQVVEARSGNEAIQLLKVHPDADMVLSDYKMSDGTGGDLFRHMLAHQMQIPFVLCSASPASDYPEFENQKIAGFLGKPFSVDTLTRLIRDVYVANQKARAVPEIIPGFVRVKVVTLMRMSAITCDLYVKLNGDKYVKVAHGDDTLEEADFERFKSKGLEYLYLPKESIDHFLAHLSRDVFALSNAKVSQPGATVKISSNVQSIIHELHRSLGLTQEIQRLVQVNIDLALSTIKLNPNLNQLFESVFVNQGNYISEHSVVVAHVAAAIAAQMNWQTESSLYKLSLAAFLHDITLDNEVLAQIQSEDELSNKIAQGASFTDNEIRSFQKHAEEAALLATQFEEIPPNVDTIIALHHESPDGKGFPNHINHNRIFPLASIFIVAHDLVKSRWDKGKSFDMQSFLLENEKRYYAGYFKKIAAILALNLA